MNEIWMGALYVSNLDASAAPSRSPAHSRKFRMSSLSAASLPPHIGTKRYIASPIQRTELFRINRSTLAHYDLFAPFSCFQSRLLEREGLAAGDGSRRFDGQGEPTGSCQIGSCLRRVPGLQVAAVTGANEGIGFITARELHKKGCKVFLLCRNQEKAQDAIKRINEATPGQPDSLVFVPFDLTDIPSAKKAADAISNQVSRLDILVNNAGIMAWPYELKNGIEVQFVRRPFLESEAFSRQAAR